MGNNSSTSIQNEFQETAHPQLHISTVNKVKNMLEIKIFPGLGFSNWQQNLSPLQLYRKHLFLPTRFLDPSLEQQQSSGWCKDDINVLPNQPVLIAQYEPYIYTLQNQILTRKYRNRVFKQHEIWKILKAGVLAINDWTHVYRDLTLGTITPGNVVFDDEGHIKIVNRFSFLQQESDPQALSYFPPNALVPAQNGMSMVLRTNQTPISVSIYNLGITLLDTISMCQIRYSYMPIQDKKNMLVDSNMYQLQIKNVILGMSELAPESRISLNELIQTLLRYKQISK